MTIARSDTKKLEYHLALATNEREAISEFAEILRQKWGSMIKEIILFGSKVRGDGNKDSDIDILIVLDNLSWEIKKDISALAAQENIKHEVLISTIRYDVNTWEDPVIKLSPFGKTIRKEGIPL
ncbi:MAG: nucleotidyltransferase domain-containing protein [Candidatus Scalindua sp.]|nr:nucleotidyltransferase domain-containing protein [Candidatus Scalindua sp.]